jgi:glyoxylase-like metal-dependent hydrolase (beta-lactamase superfamily II)
MNGEELAPGVYGFTDRVVNWYLIERDGRLAAVDAGLPSSWDQLTGWMSAHGRRPSDLEAVLLTHAHVDHIGFAERAQREAGARIYVHFDDGPLLESPLHIARSERNPLLYTRYTATRRLLLEVARTGGFMAKSVSGYETLTGGETLFDVPGAPHVVFTPGHTRGHSVFHLPDRGVVFAGDAFVTRDPYTGRAGPIVVARAATWNSERARASLERIEKLDGDVALTGHGGPWRGGIAEAARRARAAEVP